MVEDKYGNYVIQFVLEQEGLQRCKDQVVTVISEELVRLSKQKFSSNVIEKCLKLDVGNFREKALESLCDTATLLQLVVNEFANYGIYNFQIS